ncbi:hypothetical protein [Streptomyces sp. NPDC057557]
MDWYWQQYTDDDRELAEATASPLRATTAELAGLPPPTRTGRHSRG